MNLFSSKSGSCSFLIVAFFNTYEEKKKKSCEENFPKAQKNPWEKCVLQLKHPSSAQVSGMRTQRNFLAAESVIHYQISSEQLLCCISSTQTPCSEMFRHMGARKTERETTSFSSFLEGTTSAFSNCLGPQAPPWLRLTGKTNLDISSSCLHKSCDNRRQHSIN